MIESEATMEQFDVSEFLERADWEARIGDLSKGQLIAIAEHLKLVVPTGVKKGTLLLQVVSAARCGKIGPIPDEASLVKDKLALQKLEVEKLRLQFQMGEMEVANRAKERELEKARMEQERLVRERELELEKSRMEQEWLEKEQERLVRERELELEKVRREQEREMEKARMEHELQVLRLKQIVPGGHFNVSHAIKLVPMFNEADVAEFFSAFEKLAKKLNWPETMWTTLIQCRLIGKAQKVYAALSEEVSADYNQVRDIVLKAYELVPEAYRQKFRNLKKFPNETFVEFARAKEFAFDEWLKSKGVDDFVGLREIILIEEFKNNVMPDLKLHLEDLKLDTVGAIAVAADEYVLSHKSVYKFAEKQRKWDKDRRVEKAPELGEKSSKSSSPGRKVQPFPKTGDRDIVCYFCKKKGHIRSECYAWKGQGGSKKPVGLLGTASVGGSCEIGNFGKYVSNGEVFTKDRGGLGRQVNVLRDTGAAQSLILRSALPDDFEEEQLEYVLLGGFPNTVVACPLGEFWLNSVWFKGPVKLAIADELPVNGIQVVIANDTESGTSSCPVVQCKCTDQIGESRPTMIVTRSRARSSRVEDGDLGLDSLEGLVEGSVPELKGPSLVSEWDDTVGWDRNSLGVAQKEEFNEENEGEVGSDLTRPKLRWEKGILYRLSRSKRAPTEMWEVRKQIVVPLKYREKILWYGHEDMLAGHFGINKTFKKVAEHFFWPKMKAEVKRYVSSCMKCQMVGKPNQKIPKAPLQPIPIVEEPFNEILIDIVGPLPKTNSGFQYILTIMDRMSRYPEAVPLRSIHSKKVIEALIGFFTRFGLPRSIQSDCGSNFKSKEFAKQLKELKVNHVTSSPYHPESQGQIERFHQTLKSMLKKYCWEDPKDWDKAIPYLLFAFRSVPSDVMGFSPFELVFGHRVRGPLDIVRESWENDNPKITLLEFLKESREKLCTAWKFAKENLSVGQVKMKQNFDRKTRIREFEVGDKVLVLLPTPGNPLGAKFSGPWKIAKRVSSLNYLVETPSRRQKFQLCHVNMLKPYLERVAKKSVLLLEKVGMEREKLSIEGKWPKCNKDELMNLKEMLSHLDKDQIKSILKLIEDFPQLFKDTPGCTTMVQHDVEVRDAKPIKQAPYKTNPSRREIIKTEVEYMLEHNLIEISHSPWSSPVLLVKKENGQYRMCIDYRKVNAVTETDCFPLPRVEDCINYVGKAKFISKFDLLKGYWQVPLTPRAKDISAFVTSEGLFACNVMPFGMKNASATFQRLMNCLVSSLEGVVVYIDDIVVYSNDWDTHIQRIRRLFEKLSEAGLVINLGKCEIAKASVFYLGHEVGHGKIIPKDANVKAILEFPVPLNKRSVRRFLGMVGYYRRFVKNFATVSNPLTNLLKKGVRFKWDSECQRSFDQLRAVLTHYPVLRAPDFLEPFRLAVDASDYGIGAVLSQVAGHEEYPVAFFSKKLNEAQRKYSTVEKEALSLITALEHFEIYLTNVPTPIVVKTDHNPLVFLNRFKNKNQRLMRWSLVLQEWDLDIQHVPGKDNVVPDTLSR